jgi:ferrous iron transport protein A
MPILIAPLNKELKVIKISTDDKTKKHLENLGITINSTLTLLSNEGGTAIVVIKEARYALDRNIASKIMVLVN